ncbi:MAG TPA: phosphatase PAP2 family protein [Rhizomicrobium sp.]|jgi:membrane-associated phospholipid phosphatase|nr:phosphatase PAP2 family protein [Rhizomicrobium sp.]
MLRQTALACALGLCAGLAASPAAANGIESAGVDVAIALPLVAGGIAFAHDQDWTGVAQLGADTLATVGTAYALKHVIREERPDGSDFQSMPSDTAALAFAPAAFLWDRYGWEYGVPAYAAAAFVGYSRVDARKHHWYDVAASAGIAWGFSQVFTTQYRRPNQIYSSIYATPGGAYVRLSYNF